MKLDLIIPCYNPPPDWEKKLAHRFNELVSLHFAGDADAINLILVNDGSGKRFTGRETDYLKEHIRHIRFIGYADNRGKGFALRQGVAAAVTPYCIYSDNDFPFGLAAIREMYDALLAGTDIVTGRRTAGNYFKHLPLQRKLVSKGLAFFNRYILRLPVADTQAGIKGFNDLGKKLFLDTTTDRFLFDMEFILLAGSVSDIRIREIDVNITQDIRMSDFSRKVMRQEFMNLIRILFRKKHEKQSRKDIVQR